jgi:hypothetical protein
MSDVTGNIGGESVRLRGMALEDTQFRIFQEIEELVEINKQIAKKQGAELKDANKKIDDLSDAAKDAAAKIGKNNEALNKFKEGLSKTVGVAFSVLKETLGTTIRTVRGLNNNIDDSSYAMRSMSQNLRGATGEIARFAADSVQQLQDQYRAFKQMSDISGVMSSQFDDLGVITSRMGLTMDQYAGLMQDNFINLRSDGRLVSKSMEGLQKAVDTIKSDKELPFIFQRLGIQANDYAKIILQQTALNRGLNRSLDSYGEAFAKSMQKSVFNAIGLADAFGLQRSQMLEAQKKAQEDVVFAKMFENLDVEGPVKEMMFKMSMVMTGGDVEKAKKLAVSQLTGIPTDVYLDLMKAGGGEILQAFQSGAKDIQNGTADLPAVLSRLQPLMKQYEATMGDANVLGMFYADPNNPLAAGTTMMLDMIRKFAGPNGLEALNEAYAKGSEAAKGNTKDQLDSLGMLQRKNIELAVSAAQANKGLNSFGLTIAHATQILARMMVSTASGTMKGVEGSALYKESMAELNKMIEKGFNASDFEKSSEEMAEAMLKQMKSGVDKATQRYNERTGGAGTNTSGTAGTATARGPLMDRQINVKTTTGGAQKIISVGDIDNPNNSGQYNQGGPTSLAIQQLLGVLAASEKITVTGINDAYAGRGTSAHDTGRAVDFTIEGDYAKAKDKIIRQLTDAYGLTQGKDFKIYNEADEPFKHTSGPHLHVEFSKEGAAKFESKFKSMMQKSNGISGSGTSSSPTTNLPPSSSAPASENVSSSSTDINTMLSSKGNSLNNNTSNLVAIADSNLLDKIDTMNRGIADLKISIDSLKGPLVEASYG